MAAEAQRLISISLAKIAASRCVRGGVSLHKNLLVATVLQKARYIFMEEAFQMLHGHYMNQNINIDSQNIRNQENFDSQQKQCDDSLTANKLENSSTDDDSIMHFSNRTASELNANYKRKRNIVKKKFQDDASIVSESNRKQIKLSIDECLTQSKMEEERVNEEKFSSNVSLDFLSSISRLPESTECNSIYVASSPLRSKLSSNAPLGIQRINSLVSIFNFEKFKRSVHGTNRFSSNGSSIDNNTNNLQQRHIAMTV